MEYPKGNLFEELADIEHQRWADWQKYLHSKLEYSEYKDDAGVTHAVYILGADDYEHWDKQIETSYKELTEEEKDSDRDQVMRYWDLVKQPSNSKLNIKTSV